MKSKYPIREGYILLLDQPRIRFNQHLFESVEHWVFIWISRIFAKPGKNRKQDRLVSVYFYLVPTSFHSNETCLCWGSYVSFRYLTKLLKSGYKVVDSETRYHYNHQSARRFYQQVELALGNRLVTFCSSDD